MTKENNPLDAYFKKALEGHQIQPSEQVWQKISKAQKKEGSSRFNMLRAAAVSLLIGLNAVFFFISNEQSLSDLRLEPAKVEVPSQPVNQTIQEEAAGALEKPTKEELERPKSKGIKKARSQGQIAITPKAPALMAPKEVPPTLVLNDLEPISQEPEYEVLGMSDQLSSPTPRRIVVKLDNLPETKGDYETKTDGQESMTTPFGNRVLAYASTQVERVLSGEKPQLPKTKNPELAIRIPQLNR